MPLTDSNLLKVNPIMRPNGNKTISWYTSFLREHLKLGEPGFGIKSPSWPPMTKSRSLTTAQTLFSKVAFMIHIVSVAEKTMFIDERFQRFNHPKRIFSCRKHKDNEKPTDLCGPPRGMGTSVRHSFSIASPSFTAILQWSTPGVWRFSLLPPITWSLPLHIWVAGAYLKTLRLIHTAWTK